MPAPALTAEEVGQIILFVAPGFFAYRAYSWRVPSTKSGQLELLLISTAVSLPLVALATWASEELGVDANPLEVEFVLPLLALSMLLGYAAGAVRCAPWFRSALLNAGFPYDPDEVLKLAMTRVPNPSTVTVTFKDGRVLAGQPVHGTRDAALPTQQLYLTYARWWDHEAGDWENAKVEFGEEAEPRGVLVNLDEVLAVSTTEGRSRIAAPARKRWWHRARK